MVTKKYLKDLVYRVNGAAIEVHKHLGPGLLESIYHKCMIKELSLRGINFQSKLTIPIEYKGLELESDLRCDLFIEKCLVLELKASDKVLPIHVAKLMSYMNLLESPIGLMINYNVVNIYNEGQKTYVNELYRRLEEE
ncbi:GxxExxY protein [Flavobacterium gawalongense]|uniref:GxxExxY protein n=1 Tax=Flavobacterium gawalongense TaxID=2594432 RepID=A0A553BTH7_9FLAO|nr:GxxExxY protein [Flavobacterium gawalongense]TRX02160.1 GxxExxY protein [Flavobacterium gawalongense]TRX07389.1 GxxExxY protein [Flavobacterium gawalongense]TRX11557.1 GxxExxY protein [Flavobacterium gawalongense]TRX12440.1 GxxExxY protein [Flavobacterium gawalongense]TRX30294.1 GxxExxY protein [Flavobacterium gawalongense]